MFRRTPRLVLHTPHCTHSSKSPFCLRAAMSTIQVRPSSPRARAVQSAHHAVRDHGWTRGVLWKWWLHTCGCSISPGTPTSGHASARPTHGKQCVDDGYSRVKCRGVIPRVLCALDYSACSDLGPLVDTVLDGDVYEFDFAPKLSISQPSTMT
jgi:hypothetical protein